jgi:hypothetical protein
VQAFHRGNTHGGNDRFRAGVWRISRGRCKTQYTSGGRSLEPLPGEVPNADPSYGGMSWHESMSTTDRSNMLVNRAGVWHLPDTSAKLTPPSRRESEFGTRPPQSEDNKHGAQAHPQTDTRKHGAQAHPQIHALHATTICKEEIAKNVYKCPVGDYA